ncbi:MAG: hypothetical protein ACI81I_000234 [Arcobacteraceae bacterium]|jgi:hypothetical protein
MNILSKNAPLEESISKMKAVLVIILLIISVFSSNVYADNIWGIHTGQTVVPPGKDSNAEHASFGYTYQVINDEEREEFLDFRSHINKNINIKIGKEDYILNDAVLKDLTDIHNISLIEGNGEYIHKNGLLSLNEEFAASIPQEIREAYSININVITTRLRDSVKFEEERDVLVPLSALIDQTYLLQIHNQISTNYQDGDTFKISFEITVLPDANIALDEEFTITSNLMIFLNIQVKQKYYAGQILETRNVSYQLVNQTDGIVQMFLPREAKSPLPFLGIDLNNTFNENDSESCIEERNSIRSVVSSKCLRDLKDRIYNFKDMLNTYIGVDKQYQIFKPFFQTKETIVSSELKLDMMIHPPYMDNTLSKNQDTNIYSLVVSNAVAGLAATSACHYLYREKDEVSNSIECGFVGVITAGLGILANLDWYGKLNKALTNNSNIFNQLRSESYSSNGKVAIKPNNFKSFGEIEVRPFSQAFIDKGWGSKKLTIHNIFDDDPKLLDELSHSIKKEFWKATNNLTNQSIENQKHLANEINHQPIVLGEDNSIFTNIDLGKHLFPEITGVDVRVVAISSHGEFSYDDSNAKAFASYSKNGNITTFMLEDSQQPGNSILVIATLNGTLVLIEVDVNISANYNTSNDDKKTCSATLEQSEKRVNLVSFMHVYTYVNPKPDEDCDIKIKSMAMQNEDETPSEDYIIVNYKDAKDLDDPSINLYKKFGLLQCTADAGNTNPNKVNMLSTKGIKQCGLLTDDRVAVMRDHQSAFLKSHPQIRILLMYIGTIARAEIATEVVEMVLKKIKGGPNLFIGGDFTRGVIRWDGENYRIMGTGIKRGNYTASVQALESLNKQLYIGGLFYEINNQAVGNIARWDGKNYHNMGTGIEDDWGEVRALKASGNRLYLGGRFKNVNGEAHRNITQWDNVDNVYIRMNNGLYRLEEDSAVNALEIFRIDNHDKLHVGGNFNRAGNMLYQRVVDNIVTWDIEYSIFDYEVLGTNGSGQAFERFNNRTYVGGTFTIAGFVPSRGIATLDSLNYQSVNEGVGRVHALKAFGGSLYIGGDFRRDDGSRNIVIWDGENYHSMGMGVWGNGIQDEVNAVEVLRQGIYLGGRFINVNGEIIRNLVRFNPLDNTYHKVGEGLNAAANAYVKNHWGINALLTHDYYEIAR